jgi:hypothetical protein
MCDNIYIYYLRFNLFYIEIVTIISFLVNCLLLKVINLHLIINTILQLIQVIK